MWRFAGKTGARDVILHNVDAVGEHLEVSRRRGPFRRESWGDLSSLRAQRCWQLSRAKGERNLLADAARGSRDDATLSRRRP